MKIYGEIQRGRGSTIRVMRDKINGRGPDRIDVRTWFEFRPGDSASLQPTRKGINIAIADLPALAAAVRAAEADAIARGLLEREDYERHGLDVPAALEARDRERGAA